MSVAVPLIYDIMWTLAFTSFKRNLVVKFLMKDLPGYSWK